MSNQVSPTKPASSNNIVVKDDDFQADNHVEFEKKLVRGFDKNGDLVEKEVIIKRTKNLHVSSENASIDQEELDLRHY